MNNLETGSMLIIPELELRSLMGFNTFFTTRGEVVNYEK